MVKKSIYPKRPSIFGTYGGEIRFKKVAEEDELFPEGLYNILAGKQPVGSYFPDTDEITLDLRDKDLEEKVLKAVRRRFPRSEAVDVSVYGRDFT